jgi:effector-binding domain-containing protein
VYLDAECNLEIGVEVSDGFTGAGHVVRSSTPAGKVATMAHFGPYAGLSAAHAAIQSWCRAAGHRLAGPNWEIYGHWTDDPAALRTDIFYLL